MLISLPARAPRYSSTSSQGPLTSTSTCLYAASPVHSLLESTSHAAAGERGILASGVHFSPAAKQSCRSGLPACHEGCRVPYHREPSQDSQTAMDKHRCGGVWGAAIDHD